MNDVPAIVTRHADRSLSTDLIRGAHASNHPRVIIDPLAAAALMTSLFTGLAVSVIFTKPH